MLMLVRMKTHFSGTRDMEEWPPIGGLLEVSDVEGDRLLAAGYAEEVTDGSPEAERDHAAITDGDGAAGGTDDGGPAHEGVAGQATEPVARAARAKPTRKRRAR